MGKYYWTVISPDGRVLFSEYGGRDAEARAQGCAARFNLHVPRGSALAVVKMRPAPVLGDMGG